MFTRHILLLGRLLLAAAAQSLRQRRQQRAIAYPSFSCLCALCRILPLSIPISRKKEQIVNLDVKIVNTQRAGPLACPLETVYHAASFDE